MTNDAKGDERPYTMSIPAAGAKYLGLSRNGSYDAAKRGEIPTVTVGRKKLALVRVLERKLEGAA